MAEPGVGGTPGHKIGQSSPRTLITRWFPKRLSDKCCSTFARATEQGATASY